MGKEASSRYVQDNRDYLHVLFLLPQDFRALDWAGRDSSLLVKVLLSLGLSSTTTAVGGKATRKKFLRLCRKSALYSGWPSHPYVGRYHTVIQDLLFTTSRLHELFDFSQAAGSSRGSAPTTEATRNHPNSLPDPWAGAVQNLNVDPTKKSGASSACTNQYLNMQGTASGLQTLTEPIGPTLEHLRPRLRHSERKPSPCSQYL